MRHRFHALCPYFAMFPESFVEKHLLLTNPGDIILDPFSGRGTTVFQSLLSNRVGLGIDTNPVAVCVSRAKVDAPLASQVRERINDLRSSFDVISSELYEDEFYSMCFSPNTLQQIIWLRANLRWRDNNVDCFIAAMAAGCLHGESHRSRRVFSNRMPRTIATKPAYSVKWWSERGCTPPQREVFDILLEETDYRYASIPPDRRGFVVEGDIRFASNLLTDWKNSISTVITSPPYLDVTHFREDQWLRVWFLGGDPKPCSAKQGDDRYWDWNAYWKFLSEGWKGIVPLMKEQSRMVIRIGGNGMTPEIARDGLSRSLATAFSDVECLELVVSEIKKGQLRAFRPKASGIRREYDLAFRLGH